MRKIKKGDEIVVIAGKDKGKRSTVARMLEKGKRVLADGVNLKTKHVKPNPQANEEGGIKKIEAPLDISNVAIWNPINEKADRVGFKLLEDGRKVRYFKSNGELVDID